MRNQLLLLVVAGMLLLSACQSQATATPEPTSTPTEMPPTATSAPTDIPPTATPDVLPASMTYEEALPNFEVDPNFDLDVQEVGTREESGVTIHDINFASPASKFNQTYTTGRTNAYLVVPEGEGPFAGVIYLHWLGASGSNREEFLDEAVVLAQRGVVSLLITEQFPFAVIVTGDIELDRRALIAQVQEIRMALGLLVSQPNVDPNRIGLVGHDYGSMYAALLTGIDDRIKVSVLMTPVPKWSPWFFYGGGHKNEGYDAALAGFDPVNFVAHAKAPVFYQFAKTDNFVSEADRNALIDVTPGEVKTVIYEDGFHHLQSDEQAQQERIAYLSEQLGLNAP